MSTASNSTREWYPDTLRAASIVKIIVFHFFSITCLTYLPALGIMFGLGGWFAAKSFERGSVLQVLSKRLGRLLPAWYMFTIVCLAAGFVYATGTGTVNQFTFNLAWLFPYEVPEWSLTEQSFQDAVVVTWYIVAYLWFLILTPLFLWLYKRLSIFMVVAPLVGLLAFKAFGYTVEYANTFENFLVFGSCWFVGFMKADASIKRLPSVVVLTTAIVCFGVGVYLTWSELNLSASAIALGVASFGATMALLRYEPTMPNILNNKAFLWIVRAFNKNAVTIYLFHNLVIDASYVIGDRLFVWELGPTGGSLCCFLITIVTLPITVYFFGAIERR